MTAIKRRLDFNKPDEYWEAQEFLYRLHNGEDVPFTTPRKTKHPSGDGEWFETTISLDTMIADRDKYHQFIPMLPHSGGRKKDSMLPGWVVWADVDMHRGGMPLDEAMPFLKAIGATVVYSGSPGNYYAFKWLRSDTEPHVIEQLNRALADKLGADDKWACNTVLRLPGTINHREPQHEHEHKRTGDDPRCRVIRWGTRGSVDDVARVLGVDITEPPAKAPRTKTRALTAPDGGWVCPEVPSRLKAALRGEPFPGENLDDGSGGNFKLVAELAERGAFQKRGNPPRGLDLKGIIGAILHYGGARKFAHDEYRLIRDIESCYAEWEKRQVEGDSTEAGEVDIFGFDSEWLTPEALAARPRAVPLIEGILNQQHITVLSAPYGQFKTFLALAWAAHVASGTDWCGYPVPEAQPVGWIAGEGGTGLPTRLRALREASGVHWGNNFLVLPRAVNLARESDQELILEFIQKRGLKLLVVDTWARNTAGADEDNNTQTSVIMGFLAQVALAGCTPLVLHHTGHEGKRARGASSMIDDADDSYVMTGSEARRWQDPRTLKRDKAKEGEAGQELTIHAKLIDLDEGETSLYVYATDAEDTPVSRKKVLTVQDVVAIADEAKLPPDASRETIQRCLREVRDSGVSNKIAAEAARVRKGGRR